MRISTLRLLVLHVSARCDQACAHCSLWRANGDSRTEWTLEERLTAIHEAKAAGAEALLLTGGEPLLSADAEPLARRARSLGLSVFVTTNGLGLGKARGWVLDCVDEAVVSLDGPLVAHDASRGKGMFERLRASIVALGRPRPVLTARSVVSALNADVVEQTVDAARELGFDRISFLPLDTRTDAFGGAPEERAQMRPTAAQTRAFDDAVTRLAARGETGRFILEDESALRALARHFGEAGAPAVRCDAPEWSMVVEADGSVRPCFFQPVVGRADAAGIEVFRRSEGFSEALRGLGPANSTCAACVCPKWRGDSRRLTARFAEWVSAGLGRSVA